MIEPMTSRVVSTNGVELNLLEAGEGPLVVLSHGFPELAWSWRHQIPALAAAGYHVVAPDQRGYGGSSRPDALEDYDIKALTGDLVGLLDALGAEKAVFVGHDWGSMVVWQLSLLAPDRVAGVVGMSVPFLPRGPMPPVQLMRQIFAEGFFYIVYFQDPGVADAELGRSPRETMSRMLCARMPEDGSFDPAAAMAKGDAGFVERMPEFQGLPDWLTQEELDHYVTEFERTGFTGPLNWYRNMDRNWELTPELAGAKVTMPSLFVGGAIDPVLMMTPPSVGAGFLTDHRGDVLISGAGHWVQQEKPDEVNATLIEFLDGLELDRG
jgi:pimeloyl-ACP methyl ester carboxylesterase